MVKQVEQSSEGMASKNLEWKDATGWTQEMLESMLIVISAWEEFYGLNPGDPRNLAELHPRQTRNAEKEQKRLPHVQITKS